MSLLDDDLNQMCADGRITVEDADEVRRFSDFLTAIAGIPTFPSERTPEQQATLVRAYVEHYPEYALNIGFSEAGATSHPGGEEEKFV